MGNIFSRTGGLFPRRSSFDLSYVKTFTCEMGQLIPVLCDEAIPGDVWSIGNEVIVRFAPLVAPILHEVNVTVHYFFVPYRLLDEDWEEFISGGVDGGSDAVLPRISATTSTAIGTLWDYFGLPTGVVITALADSLPMAYPWRAYNMVYNQYYRDETLVTERLQEDNTVAYRAWRKDYFTSGLPWQQRSPSGIPPSIPLSGFSSAIFAGNIDSNIYPASGIGTAGKRVQNQNTGGVAANISRQDASVWATVEDIKSRTLKTSLDNNTVDLSGIGTFDTADLRLVVQTQKWLERNARAGVRYTELIREHFGFAPRDERLQRAEYIGGTKAPVVVSEVLQTGSTDAESPQGNMAGHGLSAAVSFAGKYRVQEHGVILGIMSVMPETMYQQGVDRQWMRRSRYDFFWPEFAHLSEQAIEEGELYYQATDALNKGIFGYQGNYDEMRVKRNMVCGLMRTDFDFWHLGRQFASAPALNASFITANNIRKDAFAAPSEPSLFISFGNSIHASRPLPYISEPGLVDHF